MARKKDRSTQQTLLKHRTREHVIASLSVNFVQRLILKCGHVVQECVPDYGYDLRMDTFNAQGEMEDECVHLQLKATDSIERFALKAEEVFSFPVEAKDYRLWSRALMPVFLILYDAVLEEAYWLHIQEYADQHVMDIQGETVQLRIPRHHVLGMATIRLMRERKQEVLAELKAKGNA